MVTVISWIITGAMLGFLPFNFPKARIFLGDVGSIGLGFCLGVLGLMTIRKWERKRRRVGFSYFRCIFLWREPLPYCGVGVLGRSGGLRTESIFINDLFGPAGVTNGFQVCFG